ncbi:NFX1-type zinc finger-containing protein 1-like [Uranotaenia lowii]|uniref:NFX1-type zinc finger-containing protein 1-like n=1 Tax=Uranotaenia lowii TaxID=190385 RepID=UPI00247A5D08|nr:NFX1-type zinc finger-containing protein 1-like [Uranotaenia lowii]
MNPAAESTSDDDDWFTKDIDDFVVEIRPNAPEKVADEKAEPDVAEGYSQLNINLTKLYPDSDGNYFVPTHQDTAYATTSKTRFNLPKYRAEYIQKIPISKLTTLADNKADSVFLDIHIQKREFIRRITQHSLSDDLLLVIMKIMNRIGTLPMDEHNGELFSVLADHEAFWNHLVEFFKKNTKKGNKNPILQGVSTISVFTELVHTLALLRRYVGLENFLEPLEKVGLNTNDLRLVDEAAATGLDKFTIYPTLEELKKTEIDLEPNIVNGAFSSVEHYLKIQLTLLKEDFMIPLRNGIEAFKAGDEESFNNDASLDGIRIHKCVKLLLPSNVNRHSAKNELIIVDLDPEQRVLGKSDVYRKMALHKSKRLMTGSMICLTSSIALEDLIVAVINRRDDKQLSNGYVYIDIINIENIQNFFNRELIMIESEVFFEPYHQVFNVLKNLNKDTFPMQTYIVECSNEHRLPDYISREKKLIFSHRGQEYNVRAPSEWPATGENIGLNNSQYAALKLALTHKFALIQGPPGTGKTHTGLEIMSALLANTDHQMLVICQTNNALDQLLCGLLKYTKSLVRMGKQSKNALLDAYNLNESIDGVDWRLRKLHYNTKQEYLKVMEEFEEIQLFDDNESIVQKLNQLQKISCRMDEVNHIIKYEKVKSFRVIGMTTTFAARNHKMLQILQAPIVLIEEAAEILEPHIVASLTSATQHCILIGDHQQLRPTVAVYELSKKYKMDISLFERLIRNQANAVCLTEQYRMRPEIADLIRPVIYSNLQDNEGNKNRSKIKGMRQNLFFFNHTVPEDGDSASDKKSKKNSFEWKFLMALCEYIVNQGYGPADIVVLTMYNEQMKQLKTKFKKLEKLRNIRITVADNYQGEEAKIVLLSLVRSNQSHSIGFLANDNRICIALSRARDGLYIVGNMNLLAQASKTWKAIRARLEMHSAIGEVLELMCEEHGSLAPISKPEDFKGVIIGGCTCGAGLDNRPTRKKKAGLDT